MRVRCWVCNGWFTKSVAFPKNFTHVPSLCGKQCAIDFLMGDYEEYLPPKRVPPEITPTAHVRKNLDINGGMRSNFERSFAEWLMKAGVQYEYEPYIFKLPSDKVYIPDFYFPSSQTFVEVKGVWERSSYAKFCELKAMGYGIVLADDRFLRRIKAYIRASKGVSYV